MGFLDKLKNTFFEEEYVEVEEDEQEEISKKVEVKEVPPKRKVEEPVIKKEEEKKVEEIVIKEEKPEPTLTDRDLVKKSTKLNYYDDEDFIEDSYKEEVKEEKKIYGQSKEYDKPVYSPENKTSGPYGTTVKKFQPTPIISPIYGILDKNYRKEEVIDKKDRPSSYVSRRNADLDSVRKKAYGDVSIFGQEKKEQVEDTVNEDPLLYDMMIDDSKPVVNQVTMADAEEYYNDLGLEYNVDYKDGKYEKATGRRTSSNNSVFDDDDANLDSNLFDLVDDAYKED